jgi:hypothetical protein
LVASRNEKTGEQEWKPVLQLFKNENKAIINLTLTDGDGNSERLGVTYGHPFWTEDRGWIDSDKLVVGDQVSSVDGKPLVIQSIASDAGLHTTYNFEVEGFHTYFVGENGAFVHNASMCLPRVKKGVNSNLGHVRDQAVERGVYPDAKTASDALKALTKSLKKNGFPDGTIKDTAHLDRVLVPTGNNGMAVYQVTKNGTAKLKTTLIAK